MSVIICMYGNYWLGFGSSRMFIFNIKSTSIIMIFYVQSLFMIIIHVSVYLGLSSIVITSHPQYYSIVIIIDVRLVIFFGSMWIVLGSNNSNDNAVLLLLYRHATTSHRHGIIMYGLLWPTFVDKKREGTVSHQC